MKPSKRPFTDSSLSGAISLCHWVFLLPRYFSDNLLRTVFHTHTHMKNIHTLINPSTSERKKQCSAICQSVFMFLFSKSPNALFLSFSVSSQNVYVFVHMKCYSKWSFSMVTMRVERRKNWWKKGESRIKNESRAIN